MLDRILAKLRPWKKDQKELKVTPEQTDATNRIESVIQDTEQLKERLSQLFAETDLYGLGADSGLRHQRKRILRSVIVRNKRTPRSRQVHYAYLEKEI
jgi:hypothetical protein